MTELHPAASFPIRPGADSTEEMAAYTYQSIPSTRHIRRLVLEPGNESDPLVGRLETIPLAQADTLSQYDAISYTWGSGVHDQTIVIEGKRVPITTSLRDSLRQARSRDESVALWADSICINQGDSEEKGQQVALMGCIYRTACRILICLGAAPEDQEYAHDVAGLVDDVNALMRRVFDKPDFSWGWNEFPYPRENEPLLTDSRWTSWTKLVTRDWFSRGWVVQEAALGHDVFVLWAGVKIKWTNIVRVAYWLYLRASSKMPLKTYHWSIPDIHARLFAIRHPRETRTFCPEPAKGNVEALRILEILDRARKLHITDPRDRIYAFRELPSSDGPMPAMQPDYRGGTSHLEVYREFASKFLEQTSNLDILTFVEHDDEDEQSLSGTDQSCAAFPSWVPRWDRSVGFVSLFRGQCRQLNADLQQCIVVKGSPKLQVKAIVFDHVTCALKTIEFISEESEAVAEILALWTDFVRRLLVYPDPDMTMRFICAICSHTRAQGPCGGGTWYDCIRAFMRLLQSHQPLQTPKPLTQDHNALLVCKHSVDISRNRRLIISGRKYVGLAPKMAREGDVCAIIFGTRDPYILRRMAGTTDHYKVIGAAIIESDKLDQQGIPWQMGWNQYAEDWTEWGLPTENITLC